MLQGSLDPYEKKMLEVTFAPRYEQSGSGWTHHQTVPIHRDYALFIQFLHIGANKISQRMFMLYM